MTEPSSLNEDLPSAMKLDSWHNTWHAVDEASDPSWFVRFLDSSRGDWLMDVDRNTRAFFSFLNIWDGSEILDVGCGTGEITQRIAHLVGHGRVVGVDRSVTMIREACKRTVETRLPLDFVVGDTQHLSFPEGCFDSCFSSAVLQHVESPALALAEMYRVTNRGGMVAVTEQDWDTFVIAADYEPTNDLLIDFFRRHIRHSGIAHHLPILMRDSGFSAVSVRPFVVSLNGPAAIQMIYDNADRALSAGVLTPSEYEDWKADMRRRLEHGRFHAGVVILRVSGVKA